MKRAKVKNGFIGFVNTNGRAVLFALMFALIGGWLLVTSHAATGNDLVVTAVTMSPASPVTGQPVSFTATVKNQGSTAVPAGVVVGVSFAVDGTRVSSNENNTAGLAAGASVTLPATANASGASWVAAAGTHTVTATADDTNVIPDEASEDNNTRQRGFTVASPSKLYLVPAHSKVMVGHDFTVALRLEPGIPANDVQATVSYDPAKLQFITASTDGSPFDKVLQVPANSANSVAVASGKLGAGVSRDALIMTMTFRALVGSDSTTLNISGNSANQGTLVNLSTDSAVVDLTAPDTTPPAAALATPAGKVLAGSATIAATATDNVGVVKTELYIDGRPSAAKSSGAYDFQLDTSAYANGQHAFVVKAYDAAGNVATSPPVNLLIRNWAEDINQDGHVNLLDFNIFASKYGQKGSKLGRTDINHDGAVDLLDYNLLTAKFGE